MDSEGSELTGDVLRKFSPGSGSRKMKQSRLPFQVLSTATKSPVVEPAETRKRKPSTDELDPGQKAKAGRISEVKENVTAQMVTAEKFAEEMAKKDTSDSTKTEKETVEGKDVGKQNCMSPSARVLERSIDGTGHHTSSDVDSSEEDIYMLCTPNSKIIPSEENNKVRKLTPKQVARRQEHERKQALIQQEKQEKRRKLQEEKEEKAREKEELERQRKKEREEKEEQKRKDREEKEELKRKEREEKEELKRKDREEKEKKRLAEIEQKTEEKRLKEEERRKKEEYKEDERKRRAEEKEAEEKRKQKVAQAFSNFFVRKTTNSGNGVKASDDENSVESYLGSVSGTIGITTGQQRFMPFCIKGDMRLAPIVRKVLRSTDRELLEKVLENRIGAASVVSTTNLYLELLKLNRHRPLKSERTWNIEEEDEENDDIMIVDELNGCHQIEEDPGKKQTFRTKFFLFDENRRPPYHGTWRKRSTCIRARRPFAQDTKFFDYEVDSDEEWEEEEPGESLHGSDDDKDIDSEEDYEVDNEFFVPHGHLSDEELHAEGEEGETNDDNSPEAQKIKLKIMQQEFVAEMKKKTAKIKPRLIGCIWANMASNDLNDGNDYHRHSECSAIIWKMLNDRAMLYNPEEPISFTRSSHGNGVEQYDSVTQSPSKETDKTVPKKVKITDDAIRDLIRLIHGNVNNRKFLVQEFHAFWASRQDSVDFSFESIKNKIKELASWGACPFEGPMLGKMCWTVAQNVLRLYDLTDLNLPNNWKYSLEKNKKVNSDKKMTTKQQGDLLQTSPLKRMANEESNRATFAGSGSCLSNNIVKFTRVLSKEEQLKGFGKVENITKNAQDKKIVTQHMKADKSKGKDIMISSLKGSVSSGNPVTNQKSKKRVNLLMSVPRGQAINLTAKNYLISQFLDKSNAMRSTSISMVETNNDACNEVIEIN
ncbi:chromatin assembly factor 1 subunit A [Anopheles nili]|uniref:chromatin assembly factor 1 subunit A n=1 Tax=Anopheles nili TaxID=185578 RepID=UPI00237B4BD5|nr:chromatin assembly factor 1 subunit A [Anopheles nili]